MLNPPRTLEEAKEYIYPRKWHRWLVGQCAFPMRDPTRGYYQCPESTGHGPSGLYCKQHARMIEKMDAERAEKQDINGTNGTCER